MKVQDMCCLIVFMSLLSMVSSSKHAEADEYLRNVVMKVAASKGKLEGTVDDATMKNLYRKYKSSYGSTRKLSSGLQHMHNEKEFNKNIKMIIAHNVRHSNGQETSELGFTPFTDISFENFKNHYGGFKASSPDDELVRNGTSAEDFIKELMRHNDSQPMLSGAQVDWSYCFGQAEDQGDCNSCYVFAALGLLECDYYRKRGGHISLSKQEVVDCMGNRCYPGKEVNVLNYVQRRGISPTYSYPYVDRVQQCMRTNPIVGATSVNPMYNVNFEQIRQILRYKVLTVPTQITQTFKDHKYGLIDDRQCYQRDHLIIAVGFGTENGVPYFKIRNSWGPQWGENGYAKYVADDNLMRCGFTSQICSAEIR